MLKENKWKLLVSSILIVLPALVGLILWDRLPEQMAIHWTLGGSADGWGSRVLAVFAMPVVLLVIHWVGMLITARDPGNRDQSRKVFGMIFWICPVISFVSSGVMYAVAMDRGLETEALMPILLGLLFIIFGNSLPKCRRNSTIGIKVKWALENDENWNATHRLGGKLWVAGGFVLMTGGFLPESIVPWVVLAALVVLAVIPVVYSYLFYRRQLREGTVVKAPTDPKRRILTWGLLIVIATFVCVVSFTGNIEYEFEDRGVTIKASYWKDRTMNYDSIEKIEFRAECDVGTRANGFGSPRLLLGIFENEEFGLYIRYSYTKCDACVLLTVDDEIYAIGCETAEETEKLYEQITAKLKS